MKNGGRGPDLEMTKVEEIEVTVACGCDGERPGVWAWLSHLLCILHEALLFFGLFHYMHNQRMDTN